MTKGQHKSPPFLPPRANHSGVPPSFEIPFSTIKAADYAGVYGSRMIGFQTFATPLLGRRFVDFNVGNDLTGTGGASALQLIGGYAHIPGHATTATVALTVHPRNIPYENFKIELFQDGVTMGSEVFGPDTRRKSWTVDTDQRPLATFKVTKDLLSTDQYSEIDARVSVDGGGSGSANFWATDALYAAMWWSP